jgi:hypothetical protein
MGSLLSSALKPMPTVSLSVRDNSGERVIEVSDWIIIKHCANYCQPGSHKLSIILIDNECGIRLTVDINNITKDNNIRNYIYCHLRCFLVPYFLNENIKNKTKHVPTDVSNEQDAIFLNDSDESVLNEIGYI